MSIDWNKQIEKLMFWLPFYFLSIWSYTAILDRTFILAAILLLLLGFLSWYHDRTK